VGSLDSFCDEQTGQCKCVANSYGRQCGGCQRGFFGFPTCQQCQCGGRAEECDDTGRCMGCRDNTGGPRCERFYNVILTRLMYIF